MEKKKKEKKRKERKGKEMKGSHHSLSLWICAPPSWIAQRGRGGGEKGDGGKIDRRTNSCARPGPAYGLKRKRRGRKEKREGRGRENMKLGKIRVSSHSFYLLPLQRGGKEKKKKKKKKERDFTGYC